MDVPARHAAENEMNKTQVRRKQCLIKMSHDANRPEQKTDGSDINMAQQTGGEDDESVECCKI